MSTLRDDGFQQKSVEFLAWLRKLRGASVSPKIQIADMRSRKAGRSIVALDDIEENEELFSISRIELLTVQNSALFKRKPEFFRELDQWMSLILVMIFEAGQEEKSRWWPYLQILPEEFDTLMFWSSPELAELQGSLVVDKIGKDEANRSFVDSLLPLVNDHNRLFGKFAAAFHSFNAKEALLEVAHRMATLVMAYAFDIEENDELDEGRDDDSSAQPDLSKAMVPLADMFNADGEMMNAHLLQKELSMTMVASKAIKKGQEILNDYGQRPRSDLLRRYGYITDNAKIWDVVELDSMTVIQIASEHHNLNESERNGRLQLVEDWDILEDGYDLHRQSHCEVFKLPAALILLIHAYTMNWDTFNAATKASEIPNEMPLNRDVALVLMKIIVGRLKSYNTSVAEDVVLLRDSELDDRHRMAIEVRLGEKEILAAALDCVRARVEALSQQDLAASSNQESTKGNYANKRRK